MKKILINHQWKCKKCGKWIGEDYNECSICKIEKLKKKETGNLKNLIIGNWDLLTEYRKRLFKLKFQGKTNAELAKIFKCSRQAIHISIIRTIEKINLKKE